MTPAVFLDRDGTLNEAVGYVNHESRFRLYPYAVEAVRLINDEGYLAVLVTNQSGVDRGFYSGELVESLHNGFQKQLEAASAAFDAMYFCPHKPGAGCACRKPEPGMLLDARDALDIDLERSWMVGDTITDLQAGWAAGTKSALVKTGFGAGTWEYERDTWDRSPDLVGENVFEVLCEIFWGPAKRPEAGLRGSRT